MPMQYKIMVLLLAAFLLGGVLKFAGDCAGMFFKKSSVTAYSPDRGR